MSTLDEGLNICYLICHSLSLILVMLNNSLQKGKYKMIEIKMGVGGYYAAK